MSTTGTGAEIKWAAGNVTYYINTSGGPSNCLFALQAAMQTWTDVPAASFTFIYGGSTASTAHGVSDGVNIVTFAPMGVTGTLAENHYWFNVSTGGLIDSDIQFNTSYEWATNGSISAFDLQNVGTHEFGHSLSLDDLYVPADSDKTMYWSSSPGETKKRTLDADDIAGITYLYPASPPCDTTPDSFTFTDQTGTALSQTMTSNAITVSGISCAASVSITGGTYSVNGGAYSSASGTVNNGNTVTVRVISSGSYLTTTSATLTIGGVGDTFSVTTMAPPAFDYSLSNSGNITVTQGAAGANSIYATLASLTTQSVSFYVTGLPSGATASLSPCVPTCTGALTISTSPFTFPGNYVMTVTGSPLGRSTTFTLAVNPAPVNGTCGSADRQTFTTLSSTSPGLCSFGAVINFSGSGPWTWSCEGLNGGTTANCSANREPTFPVYRFSLKSSPAKFFTIYEEEKNYVMQNLSYEYTYDGAAFYAYQAQQANTFPVYRFSLKSSPAKFFTIYEEEKNYVMQNLSYEYTYDGIAFYAYQGQQASTFPVYRFSLKSSPAKFFTIYEEEKNYVMQNLSYEYTYDGVAFYGYQGQ